MARIQTAMELYWYVFKKGNTFKVANIDPQGAIRYHKEGWELQERNPFKTREEADRYLEEWKRRS